MIFRVEKDALMKKWGHRQCWGGHFWRHRTLRGQNGTNPPKRNLKRFVEYFLLYKQNNYVIYEWTSLQSQNDGTLLKNFNNRLEFCQWIQGVPQNSLCFSFCNFSAQNAPRILIFDIFQQLFPSAVENCPKF